MINCGFVGAACAFSIMQSGLFSEMVLIDADKAKVEGEALDISHGVPFAKPMKIYAGDLTMLYIINSDGCDVSYDRFRKYIQQLKDWATKQ